MKILALTAVVLMTTGCFRNAQLKAVINDFESTPRCDVTPLLTHPSDTKESLKAKQLIMNYKVACFADWYYYFDEKLNSYKKL